MPTPENLILAAGRKLVAELKPLKFAPPVTHVYNPLIYAAESYEEYLRRFAKTQKFSILLGMNPGPFGMAQTGVPFGEVSFVRDWIGIHANVGKPDHEHPKRTISGFECKRSEVSGRRLWGAISEHFGTPERFFSRHFVANYCPLVFMEKSGRNVTPDKLPATERIPLYAACDRYLRATVEALKPEWVIGIGGFAAERAKEALGGNNVKIGRILHPSPASPLANRGWAEKVRQELRAQGICSS